MAGRKKDHTSGGHLDRIGREILRASAANEAEAEAAASSPFLYARLRSRIAAERARREEGESWLALLGVVWRAVPAMAFAAVFAFALFLSVGPGTGSQGGLSLEALLGAPDAGFERVVFAERRVMTSDEVLATVLEDEREASR